MMCIAICTIPRLKCGRKGSLVAKEDKDAPCRPNINWVQWEKRKKKHPNWVFGSDFLFLEILMMALRPLKVWKKKKNLEREEKCRKIILERKRNLEKNILSIIIITKYQCDELH